MLGVHTPLQHETSSAIQCALYVPGEGDGRVLNWIIAIWNEDLLSSHPFQFLLFLQREKNLQNDCLQILFQDDVMMKLR